MIFTSTVYNIKGQVESVSDPYYSNGTALLNSFLYDPYGRETSLTRPSGRNTSLVYNNNTTTETTAGKSFSKTFSSDGTISTATDAGGTINYTYFNDGKMKTITAPGGIVTSMQYDPAGNQNQLMDPSAGTISYTYNGFGDLTDQQNARSQTTHLTYYDDGRPNQKILSVEGTTTYSYNTNKQLTGISSPGNVIRSLSYDAKGRITTNTETIPGSSAFTTTLTYDDKGRIRMITHPSGIIETKHYNQNGYLDSISSKGIVRWTTTGMSARQQVTSGKYYKYGGNLSVTFGYDTCGYPTSTVAGTIQNYSYNFNPVTGNLNWRQNNRHSGMKEDFQYDNFDRLSNVHMGLTLTLNMGYEGNKGGITTKSDVGTLLYGNTQQPYAVNKINPTTGLTPSALQTITYTSFDKVSTISENNYTATFTYNSDDERAKMVVQQSGTSILTRWYPSGCYIKEIAGSVTKEYTFIGGDSYSAPIVAITQSGTTTYYDILRDYLGNITHVVNATTGSVVAEYSFDAWGRMRNPSTWTNYAPGSEPALFIAGRGFTGHEHLPWFNLINMNGRVYDPLLGMFLSADNYVQNPDLTQNFNRYGYCLNNPLKYSDPSGMMAKARDPESDAAFDAYFYWLCDGSMSFGNPGGGGGGGGTGGHAYHYGTMGSGFYDTGDFTTSDVLGSLWNATPNNAYYTFNNVNGDWYHTSTSFVYVHYDFGTNLAEGIEPGRPSLATMPDMTRDWLEYHGIMQNLYSSKGNLDWIHYDSYGVRSCTQYSALSGTGPTKKYPDGGLTINAGSWTANELEFSNDRSYSGNDGWGFKVWLEDQFGRTGMLIHPGMHNGTLGCIGLNDNNQLFDFINRICNYNLSPNHTLNIYVSYGN
jgi:RHS repeat-associated protein